MWNNLRVRLGQRSLIRLHTLHLKWMQYEMDSTRIIAEHLKTMSAIAREFKGARREISEEEH